MWVHANGVQKDVHSEIKEAIFPGASCFFAVSLKTTKNFEKESSFLSIYQ